MLKLTGNREPAAAMSGTDASPKVRFAIAGKVILWSCLRDGEITVNAAPPLSPA